MAQGNVFHLYQIQKQTTQIWMIAMRTVVMWGWELSSGRVSDVFLGVCSRTQLHTFSASVKAPFVSQNY